MKKKFEGIVKTIDGYQLLRDNELKQKFIHLIRRVYDIGHASDFIKEIEFSPETIITYLMIGDAVIGLGCIVESHINFGLYELFWNMLDKPYRGNGWGKIFVEEGIRWIKENCKGKSSLNNIIAVTAKPWHLSRCGFEIIKQFNNEVGEVLMYRKVE